MSKAEQTSQNVDARAKREQQGEQVIHLASMRAYAVGALLLALAALVLAIPFRGGEQSLYHTVGAQGFGQLLVIFLLVGLFVALLAFPAFSLIQGAATKRPLLRFDADNVHRLALGPTRQDIAWDDIGDIGLRGVWIVLVDGTVEQNKLVRGLLGARGVWIPAVLAEGGGARVMAAIHAYRPELIDTVKPR